MSPQETLLLQKFLDQLIQAGGVAKDAEAQAMIAQAVARQPDAAYLLVQRALLLDQALGDAQNRIAQLQVEVAELRAARLPQGAGGLLDASTAWGNSAASHPLAGAPLPPANGYAPAPAAPVMAQPGFPGGNAGNMLGTMAATAAGVAAGAFLFQGIGGLMGHHPSGAAQALDAGGASAAPANPDGADQGLIKDYFADEPAAQADGFDDGDAA